MDKAITVEKTISQDLSEATLDVLDTLKEQPVSDKPFSPLKLSRFTIDSSEPPNEKSTVKSIPKSVKNAGSSHRESFEEDEDDEVGVVNGHGPSVPDQELDTKKPDESPETVEKTETKAESTLATTITSTNLELKSLDAPWPELFQHLLDTIRRLEEENKTSAARLKLIPRADPGTDSMPPSEVPSEDQSTKPITFETCHKVWCEHDREYYHDIPRKFKDDSRVDHLRGREKMVNGSRYLTENPRVAFAIVAVYDCERYKKEHDHSKLGMMGGRLVQDAPLAEPTRTQTMVGPIIKSGLKAIITTHPDKFEGYNGENLPGYWTEPYLLFYAHNKTFLSLLGSSGLNEDEQAAVQLLCEWFEENWRKDWDECDEMLARGKISEKHYRKLFRPNDIVITKSSNDQTIFLAEKVKPFPWASADDTRADVYSWGFNGKFIKKERAIKLRLDIGSLPGINKRKSIEDKDYENIEVDITSLPCYPLRYDNAAIYDKLSARGEKLWMCRTKKLICYSEEATSDPSAMENRFMVDYEIFRRMHKYNSIFSLSGEEFEHAKMDVSEPPGDDFLVLLPSHVHAFNLQTKAWVLLRVDCMTNVTWNKKAFKQLAIPEETKEFIQALVTAQTQKMAMMNDIMAGKGNGLLILLHGAPGTGKTLTAESIAEVEERPLYRITSGDIGEYPTDVETYLSAALEIGKAWGCVVLLDEADVFIEERSLKDLSRNALISVFLRVLEYYDGILILTTNRVGIFDEAFKSRIQLALHYPNLDQVQRRSIWLNFFSMLGGSDERVDTDDLERNVEKLAIVEINGRQIRNAVTMARHLAKFRKERLHYGHVQQAIKTIAKFDEYLVELRGITDEKLARESQYR